MEFEKPPSEGLVPRDRKEKIADFFFQLAFELWWIIPVIIGIVLAIKNS